MVCLDTCHLNDAGYDMSKFDEVLDEFDKTIGIKKIGCIHINDSKNELNSHKDRHENIGCGFIGFDTLNAIAHNPRVSDIPKILETPYINEKPPYGKEIEMLKSGKFVENWKENF
jgi:deoxyribonuclease-4